MVIAAHNEGDRLWRTVASCLEDPGIDDLEILVQDDASTDHGLEALAARFPEVQVHRHTHRCGVARTKDDAIRKSRGQVVVLLDGHTCPGPGAIARLVQDVEELEGRAIVTPCVPALDCDTWETSSELVGYGFRMDLARFDCGWVSLTTLRRQGCFFENPALVGCAVGLSRALYEDVHGFDVDMIEWGQEDLDFGLKAWLLGYPILLDPRAIVAHRFRATFDNFSVAPVSTCVNTLRMARKNFSDEVWEEWLPRYRALRGDVVWEEAWRLFEVKRASAERERQLLHARRAHDERWYARRFGLDWPAVG